MPGTRVEQVCGPRPGGGPRPRGPGAPGWRTSPKPPPAPAPAATGKAAAGKAVDINSATEQQIAAAVPGVGDARAKAIVAGRPYASPEDLVTKKVLTQGILDGIMDKIAY